MHISKVESYLGRQENVKSIMATIHGFALAHCGYNLVQGTKLNDIIIDCISRSGSLTSPDPRYIAVAKVVLISKDKLEDEFGMDNPEFTLAGWETDNEYRGDFG